MVQRTMQVLSTADLIKWCLLPVTRLISSGKYASALPDNDWCTRHATLYPTRHRTGSQCNWTSTCKMWSHHLQPVTRRAAESWTDCNCWMRPSDQLMTCWLIASALQNSHVFVIWITRLSWKPKPVKLTSDTNMIFHTRVTHLLCHFTIC